MMYVSVFSFTPESSLSYIRMVVVPIAVSSRCSCGGSSNCLDKSR